LSDSSQGAGNSVGRVRLGRISNSSAAGEYIYLDNITVGVDFTPPSPVTNFNAIGGDGQVSLSWTNPTSGFSGTRIVFKTGGYPTGPTDGMVVYVGSGTSTIHGGLVNGTRYYYAAYAYDAVPNYSTGVTVSAHAAADATIREVKGLLDNQTRALRGNIVSVMGSGFFYLQDPLDLQGMKVISSQAVSEGVKLDVIGTIWGQGSERWIDCSTDIAGSIDPGPFTLSVPGMGQHSVGGLALNDYAPGVVSGAGPHTIGLLVRVWGQITQKEKSGQWFYIDDGSKLKDGTQTEVSEGVFQDSVGVRIKGSTSYASGQYLFITGVVSTFDSGGLRPQILPQTAGIQQVGP
jgi:hypothetical protein